MNDYKGWIKIPLNLNEENITFSENFPKHKKNRVLSEIKNTLNKDKNKFNNFANDISKSLNRWHEGKMQEEQAKQIAEKLSGYFDLSNKLSSTLIEKIDEYVVRYKTIYDSGKHYYFIDQKRLSISVGSRTRLPRI